MEKISKFKKIINKFYYNLFIERFNKKINYNFPINFSRSDLIDYFAKKNNYKSYLEIGCDQNQLFSKVNIEKKYGVDPESGGNIRKTSDDFFLTNNNKFDLVFIDGLHEYKQVKKDVLNSLKCLNENGIILVHDCLPDCLSKQAVPRYRMTWNGDVWKAIVELRRLDYIEIYTCIIDQGISIVQNKKNTNILKINKEINKLKFKDFYYNYNSYMRTISLNELKKKF